MVDRLFIRTRPGRAVHAGLLIACAMMLLAAAPARAYDRTAMINYNKTNAFIYPSGYWNMDSNTNPFERPIGDAGPFQAQALIAGGIDLTRGLGDLYLVNISYGGRTYKAYFDDDDYLVRIQNPNGKVTPTTAYELASYLVDQDGWTLEWMTTDYPLLPFYELGDLVYFTYGDPTRLSPEGYRTYLAAIVGTTKDRLGQTIPLVAGHTPGTRGAAITNYFGRNNRYGFDIAYVLHQESFANRGLPAEFTGGYDYNGPEALIITIYEVGHEYLGYIVNNGDLACQDEVVATTTTALSVGTHLVRGFCCNAHKGAPSYDNSFSQPWTSQSTSHWAYWVRKAVEYGVAHQMGDYTIQAAIWYITDRSGSYSSTTILEAIGYPPDGPQKNFTNDPAPGDVTLFKATPTVGQGIKLEWKYPADTDLRGAIVVYNADGTTPTTPTDGTVLVNKIGTPGQSDSFTQKTATPGKTYIYTIFAFDETSHQSPGATVSAKLPGGVWLTWNNAARDWQLYK